MQKYMSKTVFRLKKIIHQNFQLQPPPPHTHTHTRMHTHKSTHIHTQTHNINLFEKACYLPGTDVYVKKRKLIILI